MRILLLTIFVLTSIIVLPQDEPKPTITATRLKSINKRIEIDKGSLLQNVKFRNIGPTITSGRVSDIDVDPASPVRFYVSYASSGLWRTENNGMSFTPVFDREATMTIGDIAVDWKHGETIWVGTGESLAFLFAGLGIYKSTDRGKTWQNMGLEETHSISRIVIHPDNPDILWVAAIGHLFTPSRERGVYKTVDGGKTWKQVLFVDENAGAIDLVIDPKNPDILYTAIWERYRKAWMRKKSGEKSGIYKSVNGGGNWGKISTPEGGFPTGEGVGRIGLSIYPGNTNIIYACLDNQGKRKEEDIKKREESTTITKDMLRTMSGDDFLKLEDKLLAQFLKANDFPEKYSPQKVKEMLREGKIKPIALVEYLEDVNFTMYESIPVIGAELYRSDDGGTTWKKTNKDFLDGLFYSYGYVFNVVRVSSKNPDKVYLAGVPIIKSEDGGRTFTSINKENVHVDHHALWIDPDNDVHLINGNDGGLNISYDSGETWFKGNNISVSQFYAVTYDMEEPYNVYGGMQDNGVWYGPSSYEYDLGWLQDGQYPWKNLLGADGFQVQVDLRDNNTVYAGSQYGDYYRIDRQKAGNFVFSPDAESPATYIQPKHELGERPLRFNWETPIHLSVHNQDVLYLGSNRLYRSLNKGNDFKPISPDLSNGGRTGDVPYGTITSVHESPLKFGLIYIGTDDGNIQVTKDGGNTWAKISDNLPKLLWVTRVQASAFNEGTVYASLCGYKWDDYEAYIYTSDDYGQTWRRIGLDLPMELVNVVREDPYDPNILYVGTNIGVYVSINKGESFMRMTDLPNVAVNDLVIHPREKDMIAGTHGRSVNIASIKQIEQLPKVLNDDIHIFEIGKVSYSPHWGRQRNSFSKAHEPKIEIPFYAKNNGKATIRIKTEDGLLLKEFVDDSEKGLNYPEYDLTIDEEPVKKYEKRLNKDKKGEDNEDNIVLKKADNGKYYIVKGNYIAEVQIGEAMTKRKIEITGR